MEEPFPEGSRSRREQRLISIQVTIAVALYASVVYLILTNEKFWTNVDRYLESIGLAVPGIRILIGVLMLIPIAGAAIVYICKKARTR
jgi:hypothetical protein